MSGFSTPPRQPILPIDDPDYCWSKIRKSQPFLSVPSIKATDAPYNTSDRDNATTTKSSIRVACISDTHGKHRSIPIPKCDVLIHGGDFTQTGEISQIKDLSDFFAELQDQQLQQQKVVKYNIVCIAGNHDLTLQPDYYSTNWKKFHPRNGPYDCAVARQSLQNCVYLEDELYSLKTTDSTDDSEIITNIYGSPWSPTFYDWAFNEDRHLIQQKWDLIPKDQDVDILITHGPPLGRGDLCSGNNRAGCLDLLRTVQNDIKPRVHIFGHIHEDSGYSFDGHTLFINASNLSLGYSPDQACIVFDLPHDKTLPAQIVTPSSNLDGDGVIAWMKQKVQEQQAQIQTQGQTMGRNVYDNESFEALIPFFESKVPLLTGKELLCYDDSKMLGCDLQMHREPKWHDLIGKLQRLLLQFHTDSY